MKNLEIRNLTELSPQEKLNSSGGNMLFAALAVYMIYEIAANPVASWNAAKRGWDSVR